MAQTFDKQLKAINCKPDISIYAMENSVMLIACSMINWKHVSHRDMIHQSMHFPKSSASYLIEIDAMCQHGVVLTRVFYGC